MIVVPAQSVDPTPEPRPVVQAKSSGTDVYVKNIAGGLVLLLYVSDVGQVLEATLADSLFLVIQ